MYRKFGLVVIFLVPAFPRSGPANNVHYRLRFVSELIAEGLEVSAANASFLSQTARQSDSPTVRQPDNQMVRQSDSLIYGPRIVR